MRSALLSLIQTNARKGSLKAEGSTVYLYDIIVGSDAEAEWFGGVSPLAFRRALEATTGPVTLRINSPGGDVFGGRAIAAAIREHAEPIDVIVDGYAASAASVVAIAGRGLAMHEGTMLMIHKSWTYAMGNADEMAKTVDLLNQVDGALAETYARRAGGDTTAESFMALMAEETWFTPQQAVDIGLATEAIEAATTAAASAWNLTAYAKAPAAKPEPARANEPTPDLAAAAARRQRLAHARLIHPFA